MYKTIIKTGIVLLLLKSLISCSKNDDPIVEIEVPMPILASIVPASGPKNATVTINGNNFGTDASKIKVFFNDVEATVNQVRNTKIGVTVPVKAYTGDVKVIVGGATLIGPEFTYMISENVVSTFAGSREGFGDGTGENVKFNRPTGVAVDKDGNTFVADPSNNRIRKIDPEGIVTTFSGGTEGSRDGLGSVAQFNAPWDIDVDADGNVYVADSGNHRIRKISPNGSVITLAGSSKGDSDGRGAEAKFDTPLGIAVTPDGIVYVGDSKNEAIKKIDKDGNVSRFPGGFGTITGLDVDQEGFVYIVSASGHSVWRLDFDNDGADVIAGNNSEGDENGAVENTKFRRPTDIAVNAEGNLYVADEGNHKIKKIIPSTQVFTYAGSVEGDQEGSNTDAQFNFPYGIAIDDQGVVYVADTSNHRIRKIVQE